MKNSLVTITACSSFALLSTVAAGDDGTSRPKIHRYETKGNLESDFDLGCISLDDASSKYNPVDIYKAVKACIELGRYDDAVRLFPLAGTFGAFDALRVSDATAHRAVAVAKMEVFADVSAEQAQRFEETGKAFSADEQKQAALCSEVRRIGPPSYYPRYMVQHGMGAFFGNHGNGLVPSFDARAAWRQALATYLKCPVDQSE